MTLFGVFLTPVFFYVLRWFAERWEIRHPPKPILKPEHAMPPALPEEPPETGIRT